MKCWGCGWEVKDGELCERCLKDSIARAIADGELTAARDLLEGLITCRAPEANDSLEAVDLLSRLASAHFDRGQIAVAKRLEEQALDICQRRAGLRHPATVVRLGNLALILRSQGRLADARDLQQESLKICQELFGEAHPQTLAVMTQLAETYRLLGSLSEARTLQESVGAGYRRLFGEENSNACEAAWNLFTLLEQMQESVAANSVLTDHLLWLLDRDPRSLSGDQQVIRTRVARARQL